MLRGLAFVLILTGAFGAAPALAAWPPNGLQVGSSGHPSLRPYRLAQDGNGGVLAWWIDRLGSGGITPQEEGARIASTGDLYSGWDVPTPGLAKEQLESYPDGMGGLFRRYFYFPAPGDTTYRFFHIAPSGGLDPSWPAAGARIGRFNNLLYPWLQHDGAGGAFSIYDPPQRANANPSDSLIVKHFLSNGTLDPVWPAAGIQVNPGSGGLWYLGTPYRSALDGAGGVIVVWATTDRILAQRVTSTGSIAPGWPAGGIELRPRFLGVNWSTYDPPTVLAVVPSGPDHFFAAWIDDSTDSQARRVWLQRFQRDGSLAAGWPASAMLVSEFPADPYLENFETGNAQVITDGATGVYVAWSSGANDPPRGVRVQADGSLTSGWTTAGGRLLTDAGAVPVGSDAKRFDVANGANSGLIVTWLDGRNGPTGVRSRWLLADGSTDPNQPDSGRAVSPPGIASSWPVSVSDGYGGVFVGWVDESHPSHEFKRAMLQWMPYDPSLVGVGPMPGAHTISVRAWPNPAHDALDVEFTLASGARARIDLLDIAGRRVRSIEAEGAGPHIAKLAHLGDVAPGVYLLRLEQGGHVQATRVALTR